MESVRQSKTEVLNLHTPLVRTTVNGKTYEEILS